MKRLLTVAVVVLTLSFVFWPWAFAGFDMTWWFFSDAHLVNWTDGRITLALFWPIVMTILLFGILA